MTLLLVMAAAAVTMTPSSERVCADGRSNRNLNFDLEIRNRGSGPLSITEIRASARDTMGALIEQRLLWQGAVAVLGDARTVPAGESRLVFNPFTFDHADKAAAIEFAASFDDGSSAATRVIPVDCTTKAILRSPLGGRTLVYDGYDVLSHHRRDDWHTAPEYRAFGVVDNPWRYALDLVPIDAAGKLAKGEGRAIEDFYGWNAPVLAPGDGIVIAARGDEADNPLGSEKYDRDPITEDQMDPSGNYLLIDHGTGEVSVLTHLKSGSLNVKQGDRVTAGQEIARIGNSGATPIPHLHYEIRTGFGIKGVRSLPPYFRDISILGVAGSDAPIAPNTGDVIISQ